MLHSLRSTPSLALLFALSFHAGCDGTGGGTSGGSGGSGGGSGGGTSGGTAGSGGQSAGCPAEQPTEGTPCDLGPMETCPYGDTCCPLVWGCSGGVWQQYDVSCLAPTDCPADPPAQGTACGDECAQWQPCGYACDGMNAPFAECINGAWEVTSSACSDTVPCGDVTCAPGEICVESAGGDGISYACQPNPCDAQPLSCQCAEPLCGGDMYECQVTSPSQISCSCSLCP
jgi:hypothetical protein